MKREHRNVKAFVEAATSNPNITYVRAAEPGKFSAIEAAVPAVIAGFIGLVAGYAWGQFGADILNWSQYRVTFALASGATVALFSFALVYRWTLSSQAVRMVAEFDGLEDESNPPPVMVQASERGRRVLLDGRMQRLLTTFARHYNTVGSMGINAWERSKHLKRAQIKDVQKYMENIGAAVLEGNSYSLTDFGTEQLPKWAAGDFGDVIELAQTPLPQTAASSPVQE